jgi:prophage antirepressor-like protein
MSSIVSFNFVAQSVRVVVIDGNPWFVAADVCAALTIANARDAVAKLDEDERKSLKNNSVGNTDGLINQQLNAEQEINLINESGLYSLILTSRKPEAKKFKKWVTAEVLPAIRKTGRYETPNVAMPELIHPGQLSRLGDIIWCMARAFYMEGSVRHWLGKYACARAHVSRRDHIPASLYPEVEDFLNAIDKAVTIYREDRIQQEHKWLLLTLKRELDKRMGRLGPEFEMLAEDRKELAIKA